jgi:kinesin family protein C2/C3
MAEAGALFSLSAAAVVEDVLREHGCRLSDRDLASRRTGEAGTALTTSAVFFKKSFLPLRLPHVVCVAEFWSLVGWVGAAARRNEAAGWLRRAVGAVAGRDLPEEPSEEEFRLGLRNGQILCSALNRVHPGAVQKASPRALCSII